jgi:nucleotidyltransferase/DNA polymerase involved in DNA repair
MARIACKLAKPNGQRFIPAAQVSNLRWCFKFYFISTSNQSIQAPEVLANWSVGDLPGIGWAFQKKLQTHKISTVSDLLRFSKVIF